MLHYLSTHGLKSHHLYAAGLISIGVSFASWTVSQLKPDNPRSQSDRWGLFVGEWAPTFIALGTALKLEEQDGGHHLPPLGDQED